jgi:O-antigen/teichoic acid export membrane protein
VLDRGHGASPRLRVNIAWAFLGNVVYTATQWGILVALARFGPPALVGQFALGLAVTAPIFLLGDLNLRVVQATDRNNNYTFGEYLALNLFLTPLQLLTIALITVTIDFDPQAARVILAVAIAKGVESTTVAFYGLFQQHERMDYVARSQIIRGLVGLLGLALTVSLTGSLPWGLVAMAFAWLLEFLLNDLLSARRILPGAGKLRPTFRFDRLSTLAAAAFPLGVDAGIKSLTVNIPRYAVQAFEGSTRLGIFASISQLTQLLGILTTALGNAVVPRLAVHIGDSNRKAFTSLMKRLFAIGAALGLASVVGVVLVGEHLLTFIFGPAYADVRVFLVLTVAASITTIHWTLGFALQSARRFVAYLVIDLLTAFFVTTGTLVLVPHFGIMGAALGLALGLTAGAGASMVAVLQTRNRLSQRPKNEPLGVL